MRKSSGRVSIPLVIILQLIAELWVQTLLYTLLQICSENPRKATFSSGYSRSKPWYHLYCLHLKHPSLEVRNIAYILVLLEHRFTRIS
jgi:hypothetical protein